MHFIDADCTFKVLPRLEYSAMKDQLKNEKFVASARQFLADDTSVDRDGVGRTVDWCRLSFAMQDEEHAVSLRSRSTSMGDGVSDSEVPTGVLRMLSRRSRDPRRVAGRPDQEMSRERQGAFEDALQRERLQNEDAVRRMTGQPVMYGQVIQLLHLKSRHFLQILPNVLSASERCASAVEVRDKQSAAAYFTIQPRYKIRGEGDRVALEDKIVLLGVNAPLRLHMSGKTHPVLGAFDGREVHEVTALQSVVGVSVVLAHAVSPKPDEVQPFRCFGCAD
jgi:hypothetical protein